MGLGRQPSLNRTWLLFPLAVIGSAAGTAMYEHLTISAIPLPPRFHSL